MNKERKRENIDEQARYFVYMLRGGEECIRSYAGSDESAAGNGKGGNAVNRKMIYGKVRKICLTDLVPMPIIVKVRQSSSVGRATHS